MKYILLLAVLVFLTPRLSAELVMIPVDNHPINKKCSPYIVLLQVGPKGRVFLNRKDIAFVEEDGNHRVIWYEMLEFGVEPIEVASTFDYISKELVRCAQGSIEQISTIKHCQKGSPSTLG